MALPSSGQLSLNQIAAEFGGPTPPDLLNYYRGGPNVLDHSQNSNIPTSGAIDILDFYGAARFIINPEFDNAATYSYSTFGPLATITISGDGSIFSHADPSLGFWNDVQGPLGFISQPGVGNLCEIQWSTPVVSSGSFFPAAGAGIWTTIGNGITFSLIGSPDSTAELDISIREIANPSNITSFAATLLFLSAFPF